MIIERIIELTDIDVKKAKDDFSYFLKRPNFKINIINSVHYLIEALSQKILRDHCKY